MTNFAELSLQGVWSSGIDLAEIWDRGLGPLSGEPQLRAADGTVLRTLDDLERWLAAELERRFPTPEDMRLCSLGRASPHGPRLKSGLDRPRDDRRRAEALRRDSPVARDLKRTLARRNMD